MRKQARRRDGQDSSEKRKDKDKFGSIHE
jgi:hypothetical protein